MMTATSMTTSSATPSNTARKNGQRSSWLRGWRFQIMVLTLIALAGVLTYVARTVQYFPVDVAVTREVQSVQNPMIVRFLDAVAWVGFPPQSNVIFGTVILALFLFGHRLSALMTLFAAAGSAGIWFWLSAFVDRPRPSPELVQVAMDLPTGGFPSGHVLNLSAIFGFLMYLTMVKVRNARLRTALVALLALPIVVIGVARIHAGAHWPSDVLGGYLIGGIWLALTIQLYRQSQAWLSRRGQSSSEQSADQSDDRSRVRTDCWPTAAFAADEADGDESDAVTTRLGGQPGARPDSQPGDRPVAASSRNN
jgi:undecaprenyl-diphosphatase